MSQYLVTTPRNPDYNGKAYGVRFDKGRAVINKFSIDPSLGLTEDEVADRMRRDLRYEVEVIQDYEPVREPVKVEESAGADWVEELEQAVEKRGSSKKKRAGAGAGKAPEADESE